MKKLLTFTTLALTLAACSQAPAPADPSELTARSDAWEAALNAPDIDALADLYTSDARLMPPNGTISEGRDAVRAEFGSMIDSGLAGTTDIIEVNISGDIGYIVGTYVLSAGAETIDKGKYTEIWRRDTDGQWRIASDIWNSDGAIRPAMSGRSRTHVIITHEVEDGQRWLSAWRGEDSRHALFTNNGAAHVHTVQDPDNPNLTGLIINVEDMDKMNAMLTSEQGQAAALEDGVKPETMRFLIQAK